MHKKLRACVSALAIAFWPAGLAHAALIFNLAPSTLSVSPGGTVEFTGTLTNTGMSNVFLNGDVGVLSYSHLKLDDSPFLTFAPLFLPGGGVYAGPFFDVMADATAAQGTYGGTFTIQGGADGNAFNNLATQNFNVKVVVTGVPEPNGFVLVVMGLVLLVVLRRVKLIA